MIDAGGILDGATIAITGGTGTLGNALVAEILGHYKPRKVVLFSRSESRQAAMKTTWPETGPLRYLVGDIRDQSRLMSAFEGADIIIHGAALKRVEVCEREPIEAVLTNVMGTLYACQAARLVGAERFLFVSSDKAAAAVTTYGATKYTAERLTVGFNNYRGDRRIRYSAVRYGNVLGSTGSAAQSFQTCGGKVPITDPACTRFFLTAQQAARFCLSSLALMRGGEVFVPKLPAASRSRLGPSARLWG
jgi:UDP-N-acetylglucosamine 4,6-dehydratase